MTNTTTKFRRDCERAFRLANGDVAATLTIEWQHVSPVCEYKGLGARGTFRTGVFVAKAPGYRPRRVVISQDMATGKVN